MSHKLHCKLRENWRRNIVAMNDTESTRIFYHFLTYLYNLLLMPSCTESSSFPSIKQRVRENEWETGKERGKCTSDDIKRRENAGSYDNYERRQGRKRRLVVRRLVKWNRGGGRSFISSTDGILPSLTVFLPIILTLSYNDKRLSKI